MANLTIEHHATLFALLAKYAVEFCGDKGKDAIVNGVTLYGEERGKRMAKRAIQNGDGINLVSNQAYGEWRAMPGQMENAIVRTEPTFVTNATKCAWCDAWRKHDLLEYGKYYCVTIDEAVYRGFSSDFHVDVKSKLSWGDSCCEFDWGLPMSEQDAEMLKQTRERIGDSCIRDFNYHTAHLYDTVSKELVRQLGDDGGKAVKTASSEFIERFGKEYFDVMQDSFV